MALPSAEPVCRIVFRTPEAAPASLGSTFLVAIVCMGDIVQPTPRPATANPGARSYQCEAGPALAMTSAMPPAYPAKPHISRYLPPRSANRPANGATNPDTSADGAIVRPAFSGLKSRTVCRYNVIGSAQPSSPTDTIMLAPLISA